MSTVMELVERGRMYRAAGDPSSAARFLASAAATEPGNRSVLEELALAHFQSAALGKAEEVARELVRLDPSDGYARLLLGRSLVRQSRRAEGLAELKLAAALGVDAAGDELAR